MTYPTFGGDPDDAGFMPVSPTLLGAIAMFCSAAFGGALMVVGSIVEGGGGLVAGGVWLLVGGGALGLALIGWDKLTDFFRNAPPPGRGPRDDDGDGLGEPVEDVGHD